MKRTIAVALASVLSIWSALAGPAEKIAAYRDMLRQRGFDYLSQSNVDYSGEPNFMICVGILERLKTRHESESMLIRARKEKEFVPLSYKLT